MGLIKAALGLKLSDEEWRRLEGKYGGHENERTEQVDDRKRSWGKYKDARDQR